MPDETTNATFTDQLELSVDTGKFKSSLEQVERDYQEFVKRLGSDSDKVLSVGIGAGINSQMQELANGLHQFQLDSSQTWTAMGKMFSDFLEVMGLNEEKLAAKAKLLSEETKQKKLKDIKEVAEAQAKTDDDPKHIRVRTGTEQIHQANDNADLEELARNKRVEDSLQKQGQLQARAEQENAALDAKEQARLQSRGSLQARAEQENIARSEREQADLQKKGSLQARAEQENSSRNAREQAELQKRGQLQARAEQEDIAIDARKSAAQEAEYRRTDRLIAQANKRADRATETHRDIDAGNQGVQEQTWANTDKLIAANRRTYKTGREPSRLIL